MRQPNGGGSITKLSGKRRKPWVVRLPTKYDDAAEPKPKELRPVLGYYETGKKAQDALDAYLKTPVAKPNMTLKDIYTEWTATRAFTGLSRDTQNNYSASWKKRLSALQDVKMKDLRTGQLQAIIDDAEDDGMSKSSMEKDKALMTLLFDYALKNDIVTKNYAEFVKLPRGDDTAEKKPFTDIELLKIEKAVSVVPFADCILIMIYTGFRISEFLELSPLNYDPTIPALTGGKKTKAGKKRVIPLHIKIAPLVAAWAARGGRALICREDGKPYSAKYFREKCYYPALEKIGVRKLKPHSTRHTFATLCDKAGLRPEEIKRLMGHTKYDMSLHYTHADVEQLTAAVGRL